MMKRISLAAVGLLLQACFTESENDRDDSVPIDATTIGLRDNGEYSCDSGAYRFRFTGDSIIHIASRISNNSSVEIYSDKLEIWSAESGSVPQPANDLLGDLAQYDLVLMGDFIYGGHGEFPLIFDSISTESFQWITVQDTLVSTTCIWSGSVSPIQNGAIDGPGPGAASIDMGHYTCAAPDNERYCPYVAFELQSNGNVRYTLCGSEGFDDLETRFSISGDNIIFTETGSSNGEPYSSVREYDLTLFSNQRFDMTLTRGCENGECVTVNADVLAEIGLDALVWSCEKD